MSFIVVVALILVLSAFLMNLGEVARLKTATANAADAGALAAASWIVSGENALAPLAKAQWIIYFIGQILLLGPYCWWAAWFPGLIFLDMFAANFLNLYLNGEKEILKGTWDAAKKAALFTALANAAIDDPSEKVSHDIKALFDSDPLLSSGFGKTFSWTRSGANRQPETSSVTVNVQMGSEPSMDMSDFAPISLVWTPCITIYCCWGPVMGWQFAPTTIKIPTPFGPKLLHKPSFSSCGNTCALLPIPLGTKAIIPGHVSAGDGELTVEVIRKRAGGNQLGFWTMRYPAVKSKAKAHYTESSVSLWPSQSSRSFLTNPVN